MIEGGVKKKRLLKLDNRYKLIMEGEVPVRDFVQREYISRYDRNAFINILDIDGFVVVIGGTNSCFLFNFIKIILNGAARVLHSAIKNFLQISRTSEIRRVRLLTAA
jgi:hypothetical protein